MAAIDLICSLYWAQPWNPRLYSEAIGRSNNRALPHPGGLQ
jgi:hypothetical protein